MACKYYINGKEYTENSIKDYIGENHIDINDIKLTTIEDLANILAYSNSKLILPGYEVEYTTPDNQTFKTYQEASNHISRLAKEVKDVDLSGIVLGNLNSYMYGGWRYFKENNKQYITEPIIIDPNNPDKYISNSDVVPHLYNGFVLLTQDWEFFKEELEKEAFSKGLLVQYNTREKPGSFEKYSSKGSNNTLVSFIEKNKEFEQSKEIIEEWKKVNNIQYNPEEIYSRGQEFSSVVGAYSNFDVNLMMQNLLQHIEDNEKAGGKFAISAYTKPIDKQIGHLEGGGGKIKFKIYPQSEDILWAANKDVYSGSVWDASEKVNTDKKSELLGVSYTKYPSLANVSTVQPNLANIVDDLAHHHNELGIVLTGNNFRLDYDDDIPYQTKKIIEGINKILDQKYGKLVKPEISKTNNNANKLVELQNKLRNLEEQEQDLFSTLDYESIDDTYAEKLRNQIADVNKQIQNLKNTKSTGIQPTQTKDTLKESINDIKFNLGINRNSAQFRYDDFKLNDIVTIEGFPGNYEIYEYEGTEEELGVGTTEVFWNVKPIDNIYDPVTNPDGIDPLFRVSTKLMTIVKDYWITKEEYDSANGEEWTEDGETFYKDVNDNIRLVKKGLSWKKELLVQPKEKEYTSQALINTKIAALKEVAKKYPKSLIRSEVIKSAWQPQGLPMGYWQEDTDFQLVSKQSLPNTDLQEGLQWLKQIMPDVNPILVNGLIDKIATGSYDILTDLLTLSEDFANKKVVKHEAFHRVFNMLPKSEQEKLLDEGSKKYKIARGESTATVKYSQVDQNKVDFGLKAIEILQSDKAIQTFIKGEKNNWDLNKILTELAIPKEQKQLILDLGKNNREEIITDLLSNFSYVIEINTSKSDTYKSGYYAQESIYGGWAVYDGEGDTVESDLTQEDAIRRANERNKNDSVNTNYYFSLTVLGGTNYSEIEIATPAIIPSIKGHAQFATDKGIGWFRSDDKTVIGTYTNEITDKYGNVYFSPSTIHQGIPTKTRRILEVQSDLFQKGRNKNTLTMPLRERPAYEEFDYNGFTYEAQDDGSGVEYLRDGENIEFNQWKDARDSYENLYTNTKENQFLQLLNKDNNWVTFFIKSIIQDSAKKGYEKVLFPTGNTASKVEGHITLEEFKKQKEDRIKELEKRKSIINEVSINSKKEYAESYVVSGIKMPDGSGVNLWFDGSEEDFKRVKDEMFTDEINQLKQELERVETEGFGALKPIFNFYENTVTNILNKTYGKENVKQITDEFGNTWNEITITPKMSETIRLNAVNGKVEYTGDLAIEEKIAEEAATSKDEKVPTTLIGKFIQSIRNLLRNLFKERDLISRTLRDLNQGRFNLQNKPNNTQGVRYSANKPIKEGVQEVFDLNPELQSIGTVEQYDAYLDTVFPDSQVKEIVYHGTTDTFEKFMKMYNNIHFGTLKAAKERLATVKKQRKARTENIYSVILDIKKPIVTDADFDWELETAGEQPDPYELIKTVGYLDNWLYENGYLPKEESDVFGLPDKSISKNVDLWKNHDSYVYKNFVEDKGSLSYNVFEPEQIHILGSKQDMEGFSKYISNNNTHKSSSEILNSLIANNVVTKNCE